MATRTESRSANGSKDNERGAGNTSAIVGAAAWLGDDDLFVNIHPASIFRPQVCLADAERALHDAGIGHQQVVVEVVATAVQKRRGMKSRPQGRQAVRSMLS